MARHTGVTISALQADFRHFSLRGSLFGPIVELGRARPACGHLLRAFKRAAVLEIGGEAGCPNRMIRYPPDDRRVEPRLLPKDGIYKSGSSPGAPTYATGR
jgi:hypothetical protein